MQLTECENLLISDPAKLGGMRSPSFFAKKICMVFYISIEILIFEIMLSLESGLFMLE